MTSRAGVSWILARVTKYDLEREFHNYNERFPATLNADCFVNNGFLNHVCDVGLCEEPERNRSNKRHDASTVIKTFIVLNLIKTTEV